MNAQSECGLNVELAKTKVVLVSELSKLAAALCIARDRERNETSARIKLENQIAALLPGKDKGQETTILPKTPFYQYETKITIKRGLIYKADLDCIAEIMQNPEFPPPIKIKTTKSLDENGYEWYRNNHPDLFSLISNHVEVKNSKPSVSVEFSA